MHYVYLLRSISHPNQTYIGRTKNIDARILAHNRGESPHTSKYAPWELVAYIAFKSEEKAIEFEKYLKVGSGHAFAKRHFW